jgi:hypothetical protein
MLCEESLRVSERTDVGMWQRFLDRHVPVMPDLPSRLDRADGVGQSVPEPVQRPGRAVSQPTTTGALSTS